MHSPIVNQIIGTKVYHFEEIDSTNEYASLLLSKTNPIEGTVISADTQSQGKGQYGRTWSSQDNKNITLSVILYPKIEAIQQFYLNMAISLAVQKTCSELTEATFKVKWPNDIYYEKHKVAGILIKNYISGKYISQSVIGIGINVNQKEFERLPTNPTSLSNISHRTIDLEIVKQTLYSHIHHYYTQVKNFDQQLKLSYEEQLKGKNEILKYTVNEEIINGTITGIDKMGRLLVDIEGDIKSYDMGEIRMIIE